MSHKWGNLCPASNIGYPIPLGSNHVTPNFGQVLILPPLKFTSHSRSSRMRSNFKRSKPCLINAGSGCACGCGCGGCLGTLGHPWPRKNGPKLIFLFLPEIHAPKVGPKIDSLLILHPHGFFYTLRVNDSQMGHIFAPLLILGTSIPLDSNHVTPDLGHLLILLPLKITPHSTSRENYIKRGCRPGFVF